MTEPKVIKVGAHEIEDTPDARQVIKLIRAGHVDGFFFNVDDFTARMLGSRRSLVLGVVRPGKRKRPPRLNIDAVLDAQLSELAWREKVCELLAGEAFRARIEEEAAKAEAAHRTGKTGGQAFFIDEAKPVPAGLYEQATTDRLTRLTLLRE